MGVFSLAKQYAEKLKSCQDYYDAEAHLDKNVQLACEKGFPFDQEILNRNNLYTKALDVVKRAYEAMGSEFYDNKEGIIRYLPRVMRQVIEDEAQDFFGGWERISTDGSVLMQKKYLDKSGQPNDRNIDIVHELMGAMEFQRSGRWGEFAPAYCGNPFEAPVIDKEGGLIKMPEAIFTAYQTKELGDLGLGALREHAV